MLQVVLSLGRRELRGPGPMVVMPTTLRPKLRPGLVKWTVHLQVQRERNSWDAFQGFGSIGMFAETAPECLPRCF